MNKSYLSYTINEGKKIIKNSSTHHLPLSFRNKLLKNIDDEIIVSRISILCALKVYPMWEEFISDSDLLNLLKKAEDYIYSKEDESGLLTMAGKMQTYINNRNDEEHFSALYAGFSAVNAAYEVTGKDIGEMNLDDFEIDAYDWDAVFYACLAYNGGASSFNNINKEKTKEFWEWYLDEGIKKAFDKEPLVIINKKERITPKKEFDRYAINKITENQTINIEIDKIQDMLVNNLSEYKWTKVFLTVYVVNNTRMSVIDCQNELVKTDISIPYAVRHEISNSVVSIKDEVYKLTSGEGAFYAFQLVIDENKNKNIQFIYDTKDENMKKLFDDEDFAKDFEKYPRKTEYTPEWLQKILKRAKIDINRFKWK